MSFLTFLLVVLLLCPTGLATSNPNSPGKLFPSSSSRKFRRESPVGDDEDTFISTLNDPVIPFIKTVPVLFVESERFSVDRLVSQDPGYLNYLRAKRTRSSSTPITRRLSNPNFMEIVGKDQLKGWLNLVDTSLWDAVKIIESPNFDGLKFFELNSLPKFYLSRRLLVPYEAFLRRFKYLPENDENSSKSTPFSNLVLKFLEASLIADSTVDPFFKILVMTQADAFQSKELCFFDVWLRSGTDAWRFLGFYFEISASDSKSESLIAVLTANDYSGPITPELIKHLLSLKNFDINIKIHYSDYSEQRIAFFHILVLEGRLSKAFLFHVLKDPRLDVDVPTGKIGLNFDSSIKIVYENRPIVFLAAAIGNLHAFFDLIQCGRFDISRKEFILFALYHIFILFWMSLKMKYQKQFQ